MKEDDVLLVTTRDVKGLVCTVQICKERRKCQVVYAEGPFAANLLSDFRYRDNPLQGFYVTNAKTDRSTLSQIKGVVAAVRRLCRPLRIRSRNQINADFSRCRCSSVT